MGLRSWFKERMLGDTADGDDLPPGSALMNTLLGRGVERRRSLGEYDSSSYPPDLRELLNRREEVARELLTIDITDPEVRASSIPKLRELLRKYPHPLVYETLIHACIDAGRFDEAKGVAFAARQRRIECARADHPEIRGEIESLREWDSEEIDQLQRERS
jgi:pentatricopeptide repeat protein